MTSLAVVAPQQWSGLAARLRCPRCGSRELLDTTPVEEDDRGWWATLCCRACGHGWAVRS